MNEAAIYNSFFMVDGLYDSFWGELTKKSEHAGFLK